MMKLSDIFANARRLAERPAEEDPLGMDWEDDFAHSWELSYYSAMRESELVSDREFREVFQECIQAIISSWMARRYSPPQPASRTTSSCLPRAPIRQPRTGAPD